MSKKMLFLILLCVAGVWLSGQPVFTVDVSSEAARVFVTKLEKSITPANLGIPVDEPNSTQYFNIQEHPEFYAGDSLHILVSVIWGVGNRNWDEDFLEEHTINGVIMYEYSPITSIPVQLDLSKPKYADDGVVKVLSAITGFINSIQPGIEQESAYFQDMIRRNLQDYCTLVIQWYLTPVSQGGAGQNLGPDAKKALATFLGFDPGDLSFHNHEFDIVFTIRHVSGKTANLSAEPGDASSHMGHPMTATIDLNTLQIEIEDDNQDAHDQKSLSVEAQTAILTLRKAYDIYLQTYGTTEGYTIEMAIQEARLGNNVLRNWTFEIEGRPPMIYRAVSTDEMPMGAGKRLWFDIRDANFYGFGVDNY
jgi:hypothetical protein